MSNDKKRSNIVKITPKTMKKLVEIMVERNVTEVPLHFIGPSQIGKTQIIHQVAEQFGIQAINIRVGEMADVGDLIGIPRVIDGKTTWAMPEWWPEEGSTERIVGIIFLDEINRGEDDKRQALFRFLECGRLHTHELPPGWIRVAASNPYYGTKVYQVAELDPAFVKRLCNIGLVPSKEDWIFHALRSGYNEKVVEYIKNGGNLYIDEDFSFFIEPAPGLWEKVSILLNKGVIPSGDDRIDLALIGGLIGAEEAISFLKYLKEEVSFKRIDIYEALLSRSWKKAIEEIVGLADDAWMVSSEKFVAKLATLKDYDIKLIRRTRELLDALYKSELPGRKDRFVEFMMHGLYDNAHEFYMKLIEYENKLKDEGKINADDTLVKRLYEMSKER